VRQAVLDEHLDALNKCDWNRPVAQYPEDAQIHVPNGTVISGRKAIGELFAGFCKDPKDGGLKGISFKVVQSTLFGERLRRIGSRLRRFSLNRIAAQTLTSLGTVLCRPWCRPSTGLL
jgi:hypothetical protein